MNQQPSSPAAQRVAYFLDNFTGLDCPVKAYKPSNVCFYKTIVVPEEAATIDYFISYRRQDGGTIARLLHEMLKAKGMDGFMDVESIHDGSYADSISKGIDKARNFFLIITPTVFQSEEIRKEIRMALMLQKKLIPIFPVGIVNYPDIPEEFLTNGFDLSKVNAFYLTHDKFEWGKLLDAMETRHHVVMNHLTDYWKRMPAGATINTMANALTKIVGGHAVINLLAKRMRVAWQDKDNVFATRHVFSIIPTDELKALARNESIKLDHRGSRRRVLDAINSYMTGQSSQPCQLEMRKKDRYYRVIDALVAFWNEKGSGFHLNSHPLKDISEYEENTEIKSRGYGRRRGEIEARLRYVFNMPQHNSLASVMDALELDADDLKAIRTELDLEKKCQSTAKATIHNYLVKWVDYDESTLK